MARPRPPAPTRPTITGLVPAAQAPGRTVTIAEFVVEQIKAGIDPVNAAGVVGVTPAEFQSWMREGALVFSRLNGGADWLTEFTPEQQDCAVFADAVVKAHSAHIAVLTVVAEQGARGGLVKRTVRTRTVGGNVVETNETIETTLPDLDMVKWKLEKLEPTVYGSKATLNLTVTDLTDTDTVANVVEQRMREIAAALSTQPPAAAPAPEPEPDDGTDS